MSKCDQQGLGDNDYDITATVNQQSDYSGILIKTEVFFKTTFSRWF